MHTTLQHSMARNGEHHTDGMVMNLGWSYDLMVGAFDLLLFRGKLGAIPALALDLAMVKTGDAVLDVGCGTGRLALQAQERVGGAGRVVGIDPGLRQIDRARRKAQRRKAATTFNVGVIEALEFPEQSFDVVISTLMMHHLPDATKRQGLCEIAHVLKPGGRLVIVDFKRRAQSPTRLGAGSLGIQDLPDVMADIGFGNIEFGEIPTPRFPGMHGLGYARARK